VGEDWMPQAGAVVLIEPEATGPPLTAVAIADADGRVLLDVGASPAPEGVEFDGVASVFGRERMYRVSGALRLVEPDRAGLYELVAKEVEQVERRVSPRRDIELSACLTAFDGPGAVVSTVGHTVDVSLGGCRVVTEEPFPLGSEPTVSLHLDDGSTILARAAILERRRVFDGFHYRLMFTDIDLDDRERVAQLIAA